jgi:hypothetical protein
MNVNFLTLTWFSLADNYGALESDVFKAGPQRRSSFRSLEPIQMGATPDHLTDSMAAPSIQLYSSIRTLGQLLPDILGPLWLVPTNGSFF